MRGIFVIYAMKLASIAEVQPIFAVINCKDNDYWGIIVIFCTNCLLFQRKTVSLQRNTDDVLPVKVCLTALNWECEWESPTVPQQWTPLWLLSINAITRLGEKALGSGGKSEDQPLSERMPLLHDVWCNLAQADFVDVNSFLTHRESYVYYYISFTGQSVVRQYFPFCRVFKYIEIWNMNQ